LTEDAPAGTLPEDYVRFCKDADVLIHDSQFTPEEIPKHRGWGHSDCASTLDLALKAHAKRLLLFHHAPSRKDSELTSITARCEEIAAKSRSDIMIDAAKEGSEFTL
jgi:ribonuclease BN (tRNA processing enzyme)